MREKDILSQLESVIKETLGNPNISIKRESTAKDIPEWDSLNHVLVIVAIEKAFNLSFEPSQVASFQNIGDIIDCIDKIRSTP